MTAIVFDTEATGLDQPRVIEAAWLKISHPTNLSPEEEFLQRYNPGKPIALGALATHHIMDEDLVDCPAHTDFRLPEGIEYLIGYNVDYDWKVIGEPQIRRICVLALSRAFFPGLDSYSQSAVLYHLARHRARELLKNAHSAMADVQNCLIILQHILLMRMQPEDAATWEAVWRRSELARIPTVMTFGKHKGMPIKDVPSDYKRWLLGQPELDPPRNSLVFDFCRIVVGVQPKTMIFENVPGIINMVTPEGVPVLDAMGRILQDGDFMTIDSLKKMVAAQTGAVFGLKEGKRPERQKKRKTKPTSGQPDLFAAPEETDEYLEDDFDDGDES